MPPEIPQTDSNLSPNWLIKEVVIGKGIIRIGSL